ncbi:MAG: amidohydrolase family protein [Burkholderiales bacterium]|nr:amidohydrolase family protein [Burkholderiales bacterium]
MHDLVIRNALVLDGTGAAPVHADVAVAGGRIAAIGRALGEARETVEAEGLALMPGIVDNHTHYDAQITWDPWCTPSPALGVTTAVIGNCGFAIAPCRASDRERVMRNLTQVEGMSLAVLAARIRWEFETIPEYLDMLARRGVGINVACFAGHSSIRTFAMGEAATERAATDEEIARMRALVREALAAGAVGFSPSTSPAHRGEGGRPMRFARWPRSARSPRSSASWASAPRRLDAHQGRARAARVSRAARGRKRPAGRGRGAPSQEHQSRHRVRGAGCDRGRARGRRMAGAASCCPLSLDLEPWAAGGRLLPLLPFVRPTPQREPGGARDDERREEHRQMIRFCEKVKQISRERPASRMLRVRECDRCEQARDRCCKARASHRLRWLETEARLHGFSLGGSGRRVAWLAATRQAPPSFTSTHIQRKS